MKPILAILTLMVLASCKIKPNLDRSQSEVLDWHLSKVATGQNLIKLLNTNVFFTHGQPLISIQQQIYKHVPKGNYHGQWSRQEVVNALATISRCLGVDPFVMAGMVGRESSYKYHGYNPKGANGLSQNNKWSILEINHHLGQPNPVNYKGRRIKTKRFEGRNIANGAEPEAIKYFESKLNGCIRGGGKWTHLWEYAKKAKNLRNNMENMKAVLSENPLYSLTYGAIYLKLMIIKAMGDKKSIVKKNGKFDVYLLYREALKLYNADRKNKIKSDWGVIPIVEAYWRNILWKDLKKFGINYQGSVQPRAATNIPTPQPSSEFGTTPDRDALTSFDPQKCEGTNQVGTPLKRINAKIPVYAAPANRSKPQDCFTKKKFRLILQPGTCVTEEANTSYYNESGTELVGWRMLELVASASSVDIAENDCVELWVKEKELTYSN